MSLFVDLQFVDRISHSLRNFKKKADNLWAFSCPICGDSKKNKLKARGYINRAKNSDGSNRDGLAYKCHNCSVSMMFGEFLKTLDSELFKEYILEQFKDQGGTQKQTKIVYKKKDGKPAKPTILIGCPSISTLEETHPARQYIESRKIPLQFHTQIYWCDDFKLLVDRLAPNNAFGLRKEGRIILPCLDRSGSVLAIQGRSLDPNATVRYLTVKAFEDAPKTFGMNRLGNIWKRIYVVEGPFDSLFLPNCIAMAGSDIPALIPRDKAVIVYDNEPTKENTKTKVLKAIEKGYRVCIWPSTIKEKDINAMILAGYTPDFIRGIIDKNSYVDMEAKVKLQDWKRPHEKPQPK